MADRHIRVAVAEHGQSAAASGQMHAEAHAGVLLIHR
jgi:hypothetical protein